MTYFFERTALILLAGTALSACVSPRYPVALPAAQSPPPAAPQAAPPQQLASPTPEPGIQAAPPVARVESSELAPLEPAPAPGLAQVSEPPLLAFPPPAGDAFARAQSRTPASTYTVERGDTLAEIAERLGTDIETIAKVNGLTRPYRLQPGQILENPKAPKVSPTSEGGSKSYTVRSGDTLYGIALRFGTTVAALREANDLGRSASIMPGRKLRVPGSPGEERAEAAGDEATPQRRPQLARSEAVEPQGRSVISREVTGRVVDISTPGKSYKVKKGDNLERVARRLDSDVTELAKLNKLKKPYRLRPGQTVQGPGGSAKAYVVGGGDTLAQIARRFSVTETELRNANGLRRGAGVAPGRRLRLPPGYRDRGPITTNISIAQRAEPAPTPGVPPPSGQVMPPPSPEPRPPAAVLPDRPQPYRAPPGGVAGAPVASPSPSDVQVSQMGRGIFDWPVRGEVISGFGGRGSGPRNDGLNIRANAGDPVRAAARGDVVYAGDQVPGFGNLVLIKHADGWVTAYGHLSRVEVRMQQKVEQGQQIGQAGSSGGVSEPQLHFEIRYAPSAQERARPVDPALVLPR